MIYVPIGHSLIFLEVSCLNFLPILKLDLAGDEWESICVACASQVITGLFY